MTIQSTNCIFAASEGIARAAFEKQFPALKVVDVYFYGQRSDPAAAKSLGIQPVENRWAPNIYVVVWEEEVSE